MSDAEDHASNAAMRDVASDLPQSVSKRTAKRHADRPAKFRSGDIEADGAPVLLLNFINQSRTGSDPFAER